MKKAIYTVGAVAAVLLVIGFGLLILAGWGSLVEYHAFEWRGFNPRGRVLSHRQPLPSP